MVGHVDAVKRVVDDIEKFTAQGKNVVSVRDALIPYFIHVWCNTEDGKKVKLKKPDYSKIEISGQLSDVKKGKINLKKKKMNITDLKVESILKETVVLSWKMS